MLKITTKKTNLVSKLKKNKGESLLSTTANRWYKNPKSTTPHPGLYYKKNKVTQTTDPKYVSKQASLQYQQN